jgi:hypothetical protein
LTAVRPLVRIPRDLLHVALDDLAALGIGAESRDALRALLADLPLVPDATLSAQLIGPSEITLPALAVLARHVGQGLRDTNLTIAHDKQRLRAERHKLVFLSGVELDAVLVDGDQRPLRETVLFVHNVESALATQALLAREAAGLASFVAAPQALAALGHWRRVDM